MLRWAGDSASVSSGGGMYKVERNTGRLVELALVSPISLGEMPAFEREVERVLGGTRLPVVFCSDLRRAQVFPDGVADRLVQLMRRDNANVERAGVLLHGSATFALQMERVVREASNPSRRTFRDERDLAAWLGEVLSDHERVQMRSFLAEQGASRSGEMPSLPAPSACPRAGKA